jgi:hypothetical protein
MRRERLMRKLRTMKLVKRRISSISIGGRGFKNGFGEKAKD